MKNILPLTFFIGFVLLLNNLCIAQTYSITYGYDQVGNRVLRQLTLNPGKTTDIKNDSLNDLMVTIFPNPTSDQLNIKINGAGSLNNNKTNIYLYDFSGRLLFKKEEVTELTNIDVSGYAAGTYVLHLSSGSTIRDWKIIKEK